MFKFSGMIVKDYKFLVWILWFWWIRWVVIFFFCYKGNYFMSGLKWKIGLEIFNREDWGFLKKEGYNIWVEVGCFFIIIEIIW